MDYQTLLVEIERNVARIRLNRPQALNALNTELLGELVDVLQRLDKDDEVRVFVLTGSEKAFAAGADIKEMSTKSFAEVFTEDMFGAPASAIAHVRKPIIAAVAGFALGGGCELAMLCDFILAADNAKFGQPEINLGIIPGMGGSQRLTRFVGKSKAMEMCLTGRMIGAEEAERAGLVSRVVPLDELDKEAFETALRIAERSPIAVRAAKEAVNRSYESPLSEGLLLERRLFHALFATEDQSEGMAAFMEKRPAKFSGN